MSEVANDDILRLGATWTLQGSWEVTNVWHVVVESGGGITYAAASLDIQDYMEAIYDELLADFSDEMATDFLTMSNPTQGTTFGAFAWQTPLAGGNAAELTAPGVCCLSWARTLKPRVQIRKYFGVFTEGGLTDGAWSAGVRTAVAAAMGIHITSYSGGPALTIKGVAYNRTLDTFVEPVSASTSEEPAYQRRRKRGRGS